MSVHIASAHDMLAQWATDLSLQEAFMPGCGGAFSDRGRKGFACGTSASGSWVEVLRYREINMTSTCYTPGCYGPAELKRMGLVFDELWREAEPQFRNASPEFVACARSRLALDVLQVRCDSIVELSSVLDRPSRSGLEVSALRYPSLKRTADARCSAEYPPRMFGRLARCRSPDCRTHGHSKRDGGEPALALVGDEDLATRI